MQIIVTLVTPCSVTQSFKHHGSPFLALRSPSLLWPSMTPAFNETFTWLRVLFRQFMTYCTLLCRVYHLIIFYSQDYFHLCPQDARKIHCNICIYIRHIWIKPALRSHMVSLFHHTSPWTHRCLQSSPSAHRNRRVFRRSVQTTCCYWILNRGKKFLQLKFTDECKPFMVISVLMWV